ncbi:MAG TPA: hypothetical protein VGA22_14565 [Gemmatimonadales bacterium]|jgi:hypothetical protein
MNDDFVDLLRALLDSNARFLVVGAHALAVHGVPRATGDLDVWIDRERPNVERVWQALERFGAPVAALGVTAEDLRQPEIVVQLGLPPRRIDLLTSVTGLDFGGAWATRVTHDVSGCVVPFLGRAALIANKRATGRLRDLADLEALGEDPRGDTTAPD